MSTSQRFRSVDRRAILKSSAAIAAVQFASPFLIKARGETPIRIGMVDPLTGANCSWNVFRVCHSTTMDVNAIASTLIEKFGKKWYFLTPDYAYGHSVQAGFEKVLKAAGGTSAGSLVPLGTPDYSSYLIQAKAYNPQVLINVMGGGDQVSSLKQFVQFGLDKQMAVGGALFELESIRAVPDAARVGWWTMEWWWDQPGVPHVAEFNTAIKKITGNAATARNWFGYASVQTLALIANQEKSLDAIKLAHALSGFKLPPEIALQPGAPEYRAGDPRTDEHRVRRRGAPATG